jgi:hypothetical protein
MSIPSDYITTAGDLEVMLKGNASDLISAVNHKVTAIVAACFEFRMPCQRDARS